jgi:hypothetical protein
VFALRYLKTPNNFVVDPNNWMLNNTGTITNGVVVPLKLISFTGYATNQCTNILNWKTTNEIDVKKYMIERSIDGKNFSLIGEKSATNQSENNYHFETDFQNNNIEFYRIKSIDQDGSFHYSNTLSIRNYCSNTFDVDLSPNPIANQLIIHITSSEKSNLHYSIINPSGKVILKQSKIVEQGYNEWQINNLKNTASGTYVIQFITEKGQIVSKKFIKN